jgi:flavoprotein hydroxylase
VICVPDPEEAGARDKAMAAVYDGGVSEAPGLPGIASGILATGAPLAGELFPQGDLDGEWFDDVHGAGWRLITVDPQGASLDPALVEWLGTIGGTVVNVANTATDLAPWFDAHGVRWALQRPDFHLFGASADRPGAAALLADLCRQLAQPPPPDLPRRST